MERDLVEWMEATLSEDQNQRECGEEQLKQVK